jgi:hypothetical protein
LIVNVITSDMRSSVSSNTAAAFTYISPMALAHERRRHAELVLAAVIVHAHLFQRPGVCHAIPAEIVAPVTRTQFVVRTRNRVAEGLQLIGQEKGVIRKLVFGERSASCGAPRQM